MNIRRYIRRDLNLPKEERVLCEPRLNGQKMTVCVGKILYLSEAMFHLYNMEDGKDFIKFMDSLECVKTSEENKENIIEGLKINSIHQEN